MDTDSAPPSSQPKTSGQAIWSLVLGILSNTCLWIFGSIPAIVLGIVAIKNIDRNPQQIGGRGLAIAGIITGSAGLLIGLTAIAIFASIVTPAFTTMNRNAKLTKQSMDVRQLVLACHAYSGDDPDGKFPPSLKEAADQGYADHAILEGMNFETGKMEPYIYLPGVRRDGPLKPLILGPGWYSGKRVVGFSNGEVKVLGEDEWESEVGSP